MRSRKSSSEQYRLQRLAHVEQAIASVRLEGLEPSAAAITVFDRYVAGESTAGEVVAEIQALNAREFGLSK
jgi:hypothetical protein